MAIINLNLQQFGPFANAQLDLVPGVNVVLGANGTGKTFATKALYALLKGLGPEQPAGVQLREAVRAKFAGVFRPDEGDIRRLVRRAHGRNTGRVRVEFDDREPIRLSIGSARPVAALEFPLTADGFSNVGDAALFLPSREVLAMYEGFIAAYTNRELSFDETYYDAAVALSATALRGRRPKALTEVTARLEQEMGGRVRLEGARFYLHSDQGRFEAHLVAEGVRKVASVVHLIANGALRQGGLLIWDEPEANLHPRLAEVVVDCLLSLAEGGVQVVIATHDYLMADAISRANEYREATGRSASVRFFQIIRSADGPAEVQPSDTFAGIENNPLLEAFLDHHDREQQLVVQQLGGAA